MEQQPLRFRRDLSELQLLFKEVDLEGEWSITAGNTHKFQVEGGGYITWHPTTGTVQIQSDPGHIRELLEKKLAHPPNSTLDEFFE